MTLLAQTEAIVIQKVVEELLKKQPQNDSQFAMYVFVIAIISIGCGSFYVLRYMLTHTREIHDTSHKTIQSLSETFSSECQSSREQHHKDMVMSRDNVHDIRDVATIAVSAKEFAEEIKKRHDQRRPPASGTS